MDLSSPTKLKRRIRALKEQALRTFCPSQAPASFLLCVRYSALAARDDDLLAYKEGNENRASERVITTQIVNLHMCLLEISNLHL